MVELADNRPAPQPWIAEDELSAVDSFLQAGVRFLMIGGRAMQFHGHRRPAKDLDLLVEFSADNWGRLAKALRPLNAGVRPFDEISAKQKWQAKLSFYPTVEFITAVDGMTFAEAWLESVETTFEGRRIRVLSREHLIATKKNSTRQVDVNDVRALRAMS